MKRLLLIIKHGLNDPRYFIDSLNLSFKQLIPVRLLSILIIALTLTVNASGLVKEMVQDVENASQYVPTYQVKNDKLDLEKSPLYYQTEFFQLVVDDQAYINENSIQIPKDRAKALNETQALSFFIVNNGVAISLFNQPYFIPNGLNYFNQSEQLVQVLQSVKQQQNEMYMILFLSQWLFSIGIYWLFVVFTAWIAQGFNFRLTQPIRFKNRMKLVMVISFIPILTVCLVKMIFPVFAYSSHAVIISTLYILYQALKSHTQFLKKLMSFIDQQDK